MDNPVVRLKRFYWRLVRSIKKWPATLSQEVKIGGMSYSKKRYFQNAYMSNDQYENWTDSAYKAAFSAKSGAFIDVGSNIGQTLTKVLSIDSAREYIGFEPQLDCAFVVEQFIKQNNLSQHTILPIGLSDQSGTIQLLKRNENTDSTASMIERFRPGEFYESNQRIYVAEGDKVIRGLGLEEISIVKIDVEGGELEVVSGMKETLLGHKPFVFFEVLNNFLAITGKGLDKDALQFRTNRTRKLENILRGIGFEIYNILPGDIMKKVNQIEPEVSSDLTITDYVAVHKDHSARFFDSFSGSVLNG